MLADSAYEASSLIYSNILPSDVDPATALGE